MRAIPLDLHQNDLKDKPVHGDQHMIQFLILNTIQKVLYCFRFRVVLQNKVPISCAKTANYNRIFINLFLTVCQKNGTLFFLCVSGISVIVVLVATEKKRKNNPYHSAFFLSPVSAASSAICRIYVLMGLASLLIAVTSTLL